MVYEQEDEITVEVSLITSNGGHFQFSLCPLSWGEIPTAECFEEWPLEFVKDNYYGAYEDTNHPERIYVPDGDVVGRVEDLSGFPGNKQEFSYQMNLPCGLTGDLVLLQWYFVTAQDCYHEGYLEYDFPPEWGDVFEEKINECPNPLPADGNGLPLQYWNCAEIQILKTGETERCRPTVGPTGSPTGGVVTVVPTGGPTEGPSVGETSVPTQRPVVDLPIVGDGCDGLCLVPVDSTDCPATLPVFGCLDDNFQTVNVGDYCIASGECDTSKELDNCGNDGADVYQRVNSCAKPDSGITPEDIPISLPVLDNDVDGVGDGLSIVDITTPDNGSVILDEDTNELVYTPNPGYNGPEEFEYSVIDGDGFLSVAPVTIEVTPVNDVPVASK